MDVQFVDRILICSDCHGEFVFTAGEQLFFHDKQFKNDPKRCKPCKSRRSGLSAVANGTGPAAAGLSRTETRTECSECGVQTTVPFKPTQGRPVLCRQCFQARNKAAAAAAPAAVATSPGVAAAIAASPVLTPVDKAAVALTHASAGPNGEILSADAAVLAAASMASASLQSSVASPEDLAAISEMLRDTAHSSPAQVPGELLVAKPDPAELLVATAPEASKG